MATVHGGRLPFARTPRPRTEAMEPSVTEVWSQLRNVRSLAKYTLGSTRTPYTASFVSSSRPQHPTPAIGRHLDPDRLRLTLKFVGP
jgi:hypothetical protein